MASSSVYQPLDLSKSRVNHQSSGSREVVFSRSHDSFLLSHRPNPLFVSSTEHIHKYGKKKDVDCSLSWSRAFGTTIPTTSIPPDLLPLHQRGGFVYVPPPPRALGQDKSRIQSTNKQILPRPVPSKLFSHYGTPVPLSATDSESMSGMRKAPISVQGCCCCSKLHSTVGLDATKRSTDYFRPTPALMFHDNYCIESVDGITPLRRDYMSPHRQVTENSSKFHPAEAFYNHVPKDNKESMHYKTKDICELWKYEGERIGFLASNCSAVTPFKNADNKMLSSEINIPTDRSDDDDKTLRTTVTENNGKDKHSMKTAYSDKSNHLNLSIQSIKNKAKSHDEFRHLPQEPLEENSNTQDENCKPASPELGTSSKGLIRPVYSDIINHKTLEEDVTIDCGTSNQTNPIRPKSKDSIGPGYIEMIAKAILNSKSKRCMLTDIYKYISTTYSRYRDDTVCWRNIVRHHLSHYECFVKAEHNGHAHYWTINPDMEEDFANGKFHRKRRPNRRKRTISSAKIMENKSSTLGSVTSPITNWFPGNFHHPYYHDELAKPYVFFHGHPWLNEDQMRSYYPYVLESNMARHPFEKCYQ